MIEEALKSVPAVLSFLLSHWLAAGLLLFACRIVYLRYFHPLHTVPGPFLASISPLWLLACFLRGEQHMEYIELHKKYGPIVRVRPNSVIINHPLSYTPFFNWDKSDFWYAFRGHPVHVNHGSELDMKKHKDKKKKIMGGYQMSLVLKNEAKMDIHVQELIHQLTRRANVKMDLAPWLQYAAFDVVMEMVFSAPIGFLKTGADVGGIIKAIHDTFLGASIAATFPIISKAVYHPWLFHYIGPKPTDKTGPGRIQGIANEQVERRFPHSPASNAGEKAEQYNDILQWIVDHEDENGERMSKELLYHEAFAPILAGSDSTAAALRVMILYVATSPRIFSKLRSQIDAADAKGLLSTVPTFSELQQHVPYIDVVVKEAVRMYPIVGIPVFRSVPAAGHLLQLPATNVTEARTLFLPGGTEVGISQWAVSRNTAVFGNDADTFRPERWIDDDTDKINGGSTREENRLRDLGDVFFSNGPTMCTGRNVANMEMRKIIVQFFRTFNVQIVDPIRPWKELNMLAFSHWDFWVILNNREIGRKENQ